VGSPGVVVSVMSTLEHSAIADAVVSREIPPPPAARLERLRALVLLGGSLRADAFASGIGRSVLDLPVDSTHSLLNLWQEQAAALAEVAELDEIQARVLVNTAAAQPKTHADFAPVVNAPQVDVHVERDPSELRGTGGLLKDLCRGYDDADLVLVANAAQILLDPLAEVAEALAATRADVSLVAHADGTPSSVMLVKVGCLRKIADVGFVDMKEQALPLIARDHAVSVVRRRTPVGLPLRTPADYIRGVARHDRRRSGSPTVDAPFSEACHPSFALTEPGAVVDSRSHVHDSVVLCGGRVEAGATLVRSIVCPGGLVPRGRLVVDQLITPGRR
jgi:hypothetical protein